MRTPTPLVACWLLLFGLALEAQEVPQVTHFSRQNYRAQSQNWDIAQRSDLQLFFGNSGGLLNFDGEAWKLYPAPSGQIIRAVACDGNDRIFMGGFSTMGYWSALESGKFEYTSLLDLVEGDGIGNEEIWHILPLENQVLFQSFSKLYFYDYQSVRVVSPPGNCMFARDVGGKIIVPVIGGGLYELTGNGSFELLPGSELLKETRVAAILPHPGKGMLVCTQNHGIFIKNSRGFAPWADAPVNEFLKTTQLNKAIRLENGNYVFGTILSGIFVVGPDGEILLHVNQENGLQNNTVLSLFQGKSNELWVGLDKGIDLVVLDSPLKYFEDKTGKIGAVYAACIFEEKLYAGTNQGIFSKKYPPENGDGFQLLDESQGQVWDLQVFDGQLIAGRNSGTAKIVGNRQEMLYTATGVFTTLRHPARPDVLLQGTYTGIVVLRKDGQQGWRFSNEVAGFAAASRKIFFDEAQKLWALHPRKGLFRITLDPDFESAVEVDSFGLEDGLPSGYKLDLVKMNGEIIVKSDSLFFVWNGHLGKFLPKKEAGGFSLGKGDFTLAVGRQEEWFKIFPAVTHFYSKRDPAKLRITLINDYEKIIPLSDGSYLFCMEDGYAILPAGEARGPKDDPRIPPRITGVVPGEGEQGLDDLLNIRQPYIFKPSENQLRFFFSCPEFTFRPALRWRLIGFDKNWSAFQNTYSKEYTNLPAGTYEFQVQSESSSEIARFAFKIEPFWHQTSWARIGYAALLAVSFGLLLKWHHRRLDLQARRLQLQKARELQEQRINAKNEMLQAEVQNKTRMLADTTMNLVRKNEILQKIREELGLAGHKKEAEKPPARLFRQIEHLIDHHLTSEEDWKVFESNFNQLHDQFFKRLKDRYPDLTPGDMRLAAYLKMNLSSKEIAPLLNISLRGVENKRYRLRRKIGLDPQFNLTEFFMQF